MVCLCLLGGHVGGGASDLAHLGLEGCAGAAEGMDGLVSVACSLAWRAQDLREAPVEHQHLSIRAHHDVVGLQVPVDDPAAVGMGHGVADLADAVDQPPEAPAIGGRAPAVWARPVHRGDDFPEGSSADLLHGEPDPAVGQLAEVVDRDHARMGELGCGPCLFSKAALQVLPRARFGAQDLQGQGAPQVAVANPPHLSGAPHPQQPEVFVAVQPGGRWRVALAGVGRRGRPEGVEQVRSGQALGKGGLDDQVCAEGHRCSGLRGQQEQTCP